MLTVSYPTLAQAHTLTHMCTQSALNNKLSGTLSLIPRIGVAKELVAKVMVWICGIPLTLWVLLIRIDYFNMSGFVARYQAE